MVLVARKLSHTYVEVTINISKEIDTNLYYLMMKFYLRYFKETKGVLNVFLIYMPKVFFCLKSKFFRLLPYYLYYFLHILFCYKSAQLP